MVSPLASPDSSLWPRRRLPSPSRRGLRFGPVRPLSLLPPRVFFEPPGASGLRPVKRSTRLGTRSFLVTKAVGRGLRATARFLILFSETPATLGLYRRGSAV